MTISSTTQQIDDAKARLVAITAEYARLLSAAGYDDAIRMTLKPISSNWSNRYATMT